MLQARGWLPEDVAILPAGLDLAAAVADVDRASLSDEDLIRLAQARRRLVAHVEAQLLADLHAIGGRVDKLLCKDEIRFTAPGQRDGGAHRAPVTGQ